MNKNQKIALGCGGAGCLGLIFIGIVGCVVYFMWVRQARTVAYNYNYNFNSNSTRKSNSNSNSNSNTNSDSNSNAANKNGNSSSASSLSDDDQHKLYQAATMTGDTELIRRVSVKLGLMNEDFTPGDDYVSFVRDHVIWAAQNTDFIRSLDSQETAVAYVNDHFPQ